MMLLFLGLFLLVHPHLVMSSRCVDDRNTDHKPRVSCVNQGLTAVPDGIDPGTQVLVLSQNQFVSLSWATYSSYTHLHELDLSQNHIGIIDPSGPVLEKLSVLRLSNNRLEGLGGRVFRFAPALMEVYLDGNALRTLHDATFGDLPRLEVINLSRNQLPALPHRLLKSVSSTSLKTFDLEGNHVQHLPDGFFSSKPELPYVYLSKNPWLCSCQVGYLQRYLEDQSHNVYKHTEGIVNGDVDMKASIENDPESVICSGPPTLQNLPIVELQENQYCSSTSTQPNLGVGHTTPSPIQTTAEPLFISPVTPPALPEPTIKTSTPETTQPVTTTMIPVTTEILTTVTTLSTTIPATSTTAPTGHHTLQTTTPSIWTHPEFWTDKHFWTEVWTKQFQESWTFIKTTQTEISSTVSSNHQNNSAVLPVSTLHPTTLKIPLSSMSTQATSSTPQLPSSTSHPRTSRRLTTAIPGGETSIPFRYVSDASRSVSGCMVPWCWWLFTGFLLLCILSALCSCMLLLWILTTYLTLYRPIQRQIHKHDGQVTLLIFRNNPDIIEGGGMERDMVSFLNPEKIPVESQAVFRSVLFIVKGDEEGEEDGRREEVKEEDRGSHAATIIELVPAAEEEDRVKVTMQREKDVTDRKDVFRKTLYREISREEEIAGWREVEESWGLEERGMEQRGVEKGKMRYSLFLREERGDVEERNEGMEWLVGEWEMGGGIGMMEGSWGSLIKRIEGGASMTPATPVAEGEVRDLPVQGGAKSEGNITKEGRDTPIGGGALTKEGGATLKEGGIGCERGGAAAL